MMRMEWRYKLTTYVQALAVLQIMIWSIIAAFGCSSPPRGTILAVSPPIVKRSLITHYIIIGVTISSFLHFVNHEGLPGYFRPIALMSQKES